MIPEEKTIQRKPIDMVDEWQKYLLKEIVFQLIVPSNPFQCQMT
jgi:hypothetical protein